MKHYHLLKKQLTKLKESFSIFTVKIERQKKGGGEGREDERQKGRWTERERAGDRKCEQVIIFYVLSTEGSLWN